jgi:hypothetical protein
VAAPEGGSPKIASWLAKKDEIIASGKPYSLVMAGWFTPEEAAAIRSQNPDTILLAGLSANWVYEEEGWMGFLNAIANYGSAEPVEITEDMYLRKPDGGRCAFGWASDEWGHAEIYAMDPRSREWAGMISNFYKNAYGQPQHDGIIVDMVTEASWCPDAISDAEWVGATKSLMDGIRAQDAQGKIAIFNAGRDISQIDEYAEYMDGYVMENFLGEWGADYRAGLEAAEGDYIVVYAADTDDTGVKNLTRMRLGLTLSMLNDNTYFAYDFGPRDHGQAWWFPEYDADLGAPLGAYYEKDGAYWREFERGIVVSSPYADVNVGFSGEYSDISSGSRGVEFVVEAGDGRIFEKVE